MYKWGSKLQHLRIIIKVYPGQLLKLPVVATGQRDGIVPTVVQAIFKLLCTIIAALYFTFLDYPDEVRVAVWQYNGNILYIHGKHIPLFL